MPSRYHELGSGLFQLQTLQFAISVIPRAPDSLESTSNPAASMVSFGMVQGSHGSSSTGVAATELVGSATGALSVAPPHPATDTITPTRPATHHRVALTSGWTRRMSVRFRDDLTHLLTSARPRSLRSGGAQSS